MNTPASCTLYSPLGRVVLRRIGTDLLLVPVSGEVARRNCVFPLNETAAFIWGRLGEGLSVVEAAAALAREFDVDPIQALDDCRELVDQLVAEELLEARPS